ncbi:endonuclease/exonuclease/phosphatase family protein [Sphingobacterium spiritivorum]|uniref:endonuclease/exonuclease/phosphatase family protein n=1 Tax=Sphingobacterium spiritivorum TaxID=258 RepID=UPI003DA1FE15
MTIFLYILSVLWILMTFIPLIRHDYWTFRVFEYPRLQKLVMSAATFLSVIILCPSTTFRNILLAGLGLTILYLLKQILPFTPFSAKQVLKVKDKRPEQDLKIMISNVYEDNNNYEGCIRVINDTDADMVLLLETSHAWEKALRSIDKKYPYSVKEPIDNTYGMLLFSKFELRDAEVKYLVEDDIPSIHTKIVLQNGQEVQIYALHPTPPVPNENPRSTERDKELLLVADMARKSRLPVIVCGDLNDVAWSYTTELFLKMSQLLDPRRGRFFMNTFHAHYPILRFPLDHIFCSTDFKLVCMKRLHNYDSDHFPIFTHLQFENSAKYQQEAMEVDQEDIEMAQEKKEKC